jgi:D-alanyl-D-alanine carboxypeptidase
MSMTPPRGASAPSALRAFALVVVLTGSGCSAVGPSGPGGLVASPSTSTRPPAPSATPVKTATASPARASAPPPAMLGPLPAGELDATRSAALQAVINADVANGQPDVIAAVITTDGIWTGAAGRGGPDLRAVTADDEFAIASITKTVVATLVLDLVEEGRMDLDAPLASYLGDLQVDTNEATVRQALGMRAGLQESRAQVLDMAYADPARAWTAPEIVRTFDPPTSPAGTAFLYSNPTYKLLGFATEHVAGMSLASAVRTRLVEPMGLTRLLVQGPDAKTPKPWALPLDGHLGGRDAGSFGIGQALPSLADATFSAGGSSMASDARSLAIWGWHLFAGDLVDPASVRLMETVDPAGEGLGLNRFSEFGGRPAFGHAGTKSGYGSLLVAFPDDGAVVVVFINDSDADTFKTARRLIAAVR